MNVPKTRRYGRFQRWYGQHKDLLLVAFGTILYLSWFFLLERTVTNHYHIIRVGLDDYIPFCEYFIVPYVIWYFYVAFAWVWFYRHDRETYRRLSVFLFSGMFLSLFICTVYPNGTAFRPEIDPDKNIFCAAVSLLYSADTPTNVLPSIHVYNSIGVHIAIMKTACLKDCSVKIGFGRRVPAEKLLQASSLVLCVLICMATVFLKQHSVVDVFAACFMAYVVYGAVYEPQTAETGAFSAWRARRKEILRRSAE